MTQNLTTPPRAAPGLSRLDHACLARLLKAGHLATATKLYRMACLCSIRESKLKISELVAQAEANGSGTG
jgi:hypothetical protein